MKLFSISFPQERRSIPLVWEENVARASV